MRRRRHTMSPRKLDLALTLGIVLEVLEILRRTPAWLIFVIAIPVFMVVYIVAMHPWWTLAMVVATIAIRAAVARR